MSRRNQKNPLLGRILLISIGVHIIALPVLARLGVFDKVQKSMGLGERVVTLAAPPEHREKSSEAQKKAADKSVAKKSAAGAAKKAAGGPKGSNLNQPKVLAAGGDGPGGADAPTVDANASGKAGMVPTEKGKPGGNGGTAETKPPEPAPTPTPTPKEPVAPPKPTEPPPKPVINPPAKHVPVFADVEPTVQPDPVIPDDLRAEPFEKTLLVEADVSAAGEPTNVRIGKSTGVDALDRIGLETARKWRFRPATEDGQPVATKVRFRIVFKVE